MFWKKDRAPHSLDIDIRFLLANERTLLAWVRTGLALIGGGLAVGLTARDHPKMIIVAFGAIIMGGLLNFVGYLRYRAADSAIRNGELPPTGIAGLLVVAGATCFSAAILLSIVVF